MKKIMKKIIFLLVCLNVLDIVCSSIMFLYFGFWDTERNILMRYVYEHTGYFGVFSLKILFSAGLLWLYLNIQKMHVKRYLLYMACIVCMVYAYTGIAHVTNMYHIVHECGENHCDMYEEIPYISKWDCDSNTCRLMTYNERTGTWTWKEGNEEVPAEEILNKIKPTN